MPDWERQHNYNNRNVIQKLEDIYNVSPERSILSGFCFALSSSSIRDTSCVNEYTFKLDLTRDDKSDLSFKFEDGQLTFVEKYTSTNWHSYVDTIVIKATKQQFSQIYDEVNSAIEDFISAQKGSAL